MRTTVTLDPEVEALLKRTMRERGSSFKQTLNSAIRAGLGRGGRGGKSAPFKVKTYSMGYRADLDLTKALNLAGALEDAETARKLNVRK